MRTPRFIILYLFVATATWLVAASGCSSPAQQGTPAPMARAEALEVARQAAVGHGYDLDKYKLDAFGEELSEDKKSWVFVFLCKPVPPPGCYFMVTVDRATGTTILDRGL
jgi:hypothetical protein